MLHEVYINTAALHPLYISETLYGAEMAAHAARGGFVGA